MEIQQFSLLGSSNLLESSFDAVTPLLGSHVTIHNVTGNIEDGISDNDLAGVGHCIPTEDHERAFLIDVVHVVDTIGNDALDHLVGLLQSVDAVGFFCEQLNGILSVQEAQELFCQFGVLGVGRNLKLLNGAHNIAGLAVIQNGCAGQTKLKAVSTGSIGHFAFHPVAVGDEQSLVHHHVGLALGMVQSNGAIHQVAIGADLCHVLENLEGLIRTERTGRVGGDCLHVVDASGRCQRGPQHAFEVAGVDTLIGKQCDTLFLGLVAQFKEVIPGHRCYDDITPQRFNELLDNIEAASPQDSLQYIHTYRANDKIVIGRKIYDMHHTSTPLGYIMLYIDESQLSRYIFTDVSFGEGSNFLLIDAAGNVVSSQNAELLGEDLADDPIFQQITAHRQAGENNFLCELNGVDTLTIFKYNTTYNVYLAATIPQAYITNGTRTINMMLIALAAVLVVVSLFLTLLVYRSVMHPIDNMVAACNAKSDEEIGLKINDTSPDELGFLARTIDNMVNEIGLLAQRWSDDQRKMRELELQTLQYQINPHFLFNTLNTLKWIATLNHVTPVSHGIDALSSLLQSTLIKKDELIPFDDELRNLKNYCDIQQLRYAGRFEMEYQIEDAAGYWTVPRFILQPLVENSILHGTADEDDFVTITVRATVSENLLTIRISDTGCGFDTSAIKEKNSERFSGIGLSNVDERMRLHYGNEYGLTIESAPGIGTQCILRIPNEAIR